MLAGARILVTGGRGFIGSRVTRRLVESGAEVVSLGRSGGEQAAGEAVRHIEADLLSGQDLTAAMRGVEQVVHLAGQSGGIQFQQGGQAEVYYANQAITRAVLEAAWRAGVRRVFLASSGVVYRDSQEPLLAETAPLVTPADRSLSGYAWSKLSDEAVAGWLSQPGGFETVVGRFTNVYGPGGSFDPARSTVIHALIRKAVEAAPADAMQVWGDGTAVRSFIHVDDAARAALSVLEHGTSGEIYNIDTSEPVSVRQLAQMIATAVDPGITLEFDSTRPQGASRRVLDSSKLKALGFAPEVTLDAGIAETVQIYREAVSRAAS